MYVDSSRPHLVDGFTKKTITAMIEGAREAAIEAGMMKPGLFDAGIRALCKTAEKDVSPATPGREGGVRLTRALARRCLTALPAEPGCCVVVYSKI
jgi:hypothetical protein